MTQERVTLEKDGNKKFLKKESGLIAVLKADGWKEVVAKKKKQSKKEEKSED